MSIHKKGRREARQRNRHLAKLGRPGMPKRISKEKSAHRLAALIAGEKRRAAKVRK